MGETESLRYEFTVSPSDIEQVHKSEIDRAWSQERRKFVILLTAAALLLLLSRASGNFEIPLFILAGLTLVTAVGALITAALRRREKAPPFESVPIVIVAGKAAIARQAPGIKAEVEWVSVGDIVINDFGLSISVPGSPWWIPLSAFATRENMAKEKERLENMRDVGAAARSILDNKTAPSTRILH